MGGCGLCLALRGDGVSHLPGAWGFLSLPESEAAAVAGMTGWKELGPGISLPFLCLH